MSEAGADIAVESWVSEFWPRPRFSYLPYLYNLLVATFICLCLVRVEPFGLSSHSRGLFQWLPLANGGRRRQRFGLERRHKLP